MMKLTYELILFQFLSAVLAQDDPCLEINYKALDQWQRSVTNTQMNHLCDNLLADGWYRPTSYAGNLMPTECQRYGFRCGTASPIWMNGSFPEEGDIHNVTACVSYYNGDCCAQSYDIQVKNCGEFYVYNLKHTIGCYQAYCFGDDIPCPVGETSDNHGFTPGCEYDPCLDVNYKTLDQWQRSVNNTEFGKLCDNVLTEGWYRPTSPAGDSMPRECLRYGFRCGTAGPIWMNGTYPPVGNVNNVTACVSSYSGDCCAKSYDIQVKNCGDYPVYNLKHTVGCYEAYCFGDEIPCPVGETSDNHGFTPGCEFDPCYHGNFKVLRGEVKRSSNYTLTEEDVAIEDSRLATGWYKIESLTGNDIVNENVSMMQCGTLYPLWMQGSIPDITEKTVNRSVCRTGLSGQCSERYEIQVRNCGTFRTYYLMQLNVDKSAYCFGTLPVPVLTTTIKPNHGYKENDHKKDDGHIIAIVIILVLIIVTLVVFLTIKFCKTRNHQKSAVSCANLKLPAAAYVVDQYPPSYEEAIQNDKNNRVHEKARKNMSVDINSTKGWSIPPYSTRLREEEATFYKQ